MVSGLVTETKVDEGVRPCANPECDNLEVDVEQDGDHLYFECEDCGFAFGWTRISENRIEGNCAVGVPERVRRAASLPAEQYVESERLGRTALRAPVELGLTIGIRPSE
jgi:hypothetical protein